MEHYKTTITSKLQDIDIGMLILNAGNAFPGPYKDLHDWEVELVVNICAVQIPYMIKLTLDQ